MPDWVPGLVAVLFVVLVIYSSPHCTRWNSPRNSARHTGHLARGKPAQEDKTRQQVSNHWWNKRLF